jgi:FAD-dependent urate hydroxylase
MARCDVAIIGAGPYGLSAAAHVKAIRGLDVQVFGEPMAFWERQMPVGMRLRSPWAASHIADPKREFTLDAYQVASGNHLAPPVPLDRFVDYGRWFQRYVTPDLDSRRITRIESASNGFDLTIDDGERLKARRVVVAAGIGSFARRPPVFDAVPRELVSHTSEHRDLRCLSRRRVIVIGGGQSALENAALLHEAGADVEVIVRSRGIHWLVRSAGLHRGAMTRFLYAPTDIGPAGISRIVAVPDLVRKFPRQAQDYFRVRSTRPAGAGWLKPRLEPVTMSLGRVVTSAAAAGGRVKLKLDDGSERVADHVMLGTGYRPDVTKYEFLSPRLVDEIDRVNGFPKLGPGLEASVPGLHFLGAPAAWSFGPLMCFVAGTQYTGAALARHIVGAH